MKRVPLHRADHRQRGAGAAAGVFDDAHARTEGASPFGRFDHRQGHPILVGPRRIEELELDDHIGGPVCHEPAQADDGGAADGLEDGLAERGR